MWFWFGEGCWEGCVFLGSVGGSLGLGIVLLEGRGISKFIIFEVLFFYGFLGVMMKVWREDSDGCLWVFKRCFLGFIRNNCWDWLEFGGVVLFRWE